MNGRSDRRCEGSCQNDVTGALILLLIMLLFASVTTAYAGDDPAVVTVVSGKAISRRPGQEGTHPLKRGDAVLAADTVETGSNARMQVRLADGAVINISPSSTLRISQYSFTKSSMRRSAVINLLQGSARFFVQQPDKLLVSRGTQLERTEGSSFVIETAQARIDSWESDVVVETNPEKSTVYTLGGGVTVRNRSDLVVGTTRVGENLFAIVEPKKAPTIPSIIPQQQRRIFVRDARQF